MKWKAIYKKSANFVVLKKRPEEAIFKSNKMHFFYKCLQWNAG